MIGHATSSKSLLEGAPAPKFGVQSRLSGRENQAPQGPEKRTIFA